MLQSHPSSKGTFLYIFTVGMDACQVEFPG